MHHCCPPFTALICRIVALAFCTLRFLFGATLKSLSVAYLSPTIVRSFPLLGSADPGHYSSVFRLACRSPTLGLSAMRFPPLKISYYSANY